VKKKETSGKRSYGSVIAYKRAVSMMSRLGYFITPNETDLTVDWKCGRQPVEVGDVVTIRSGSYSGTRGTVTMMSKDGTVVLSASFRGSTMVLTVPASIVHVVPH
jgi:transcription antitermination factor NusG